MRRMVFFDEATKLLRLSKQQLRRMWQRGDLPEPIRISPRRLAWPAEQLEAWLLSRASQKATEKMEA